MTKGERALRTLIATKPAGPTRQAAQHGLDDLLAMRSQVDALADARERLAMLVPIGEDHGSVEEDITRMVGRLRATIAVQRSAIDAVWDEIGGREQHDEDLPGAVRTALFDLATERDGARAQVIAADLGHAVTLKDLDDARAAIRPALSMLAECALFMDDALMGERRRSLRDRLTVAISELDVRP